MHSKDLNQNRVAEPLVSLAKLPISTDCYRIPLVRTLPRAVNRMRLLIRQVPRSTPLTHAGMGVCHAMIHTRPSLCMCYCAEFVPSAQSVYIYVRRQGHNFLECWGPAPLHGVVDDLHTKRPVTCQSWVIDKTNSN